MALVNESITTPTDTNPIDGAHENKDMEPFEQKHVPQVVTDTQMQLDNENPSLSADIEPKNLPNKEEENIVDKQQLDVQTNKEAGELDTSTEAAAAEEPIKSALKDDAKLVDQKVADQNDDVIVKEENIDQQEDIVLLDQPQAPQKTTTPPPQNQQQIGDEGDGNGLASSLWIRNITNSTKAADLKTLFSKHGKVITAKIFTTKNKQSPTCFGYVTLSDPETADLCVQKLNRLNFKGRVINVEKADNSNLSQISKNANTTEPQQQQQKDSENTTDKPADVVEGRPARIKTPAESIGQPSSGAKRYVRTTHRENARDAALPSSKWRGTNSYSVRDRYGGTSSMRSRISSYAARQAASYAAHKAAPTSSYYPMRRIVQTSRGVRISTSAYPYNAAQIGRERYEPPPESHHRTSSHLSSHSHPSALSSHHHRESRRVSPGQSDKEEMIRMMRRREEEHRKKEEELRLEREREKLKYEREKLEREKLELETMKLQAQLAHATHMQIAGFPVATAAALSGTSASTAPQHYIAQHGRAGVGPSSRRDQIANKERKAPIKRSSKEISTSSRHSDHRSNSRDVRRGGFSEGIESRRSNRSRSRSPINRMAMASAGAERQQRSYHPEPAALPRQRGESRQQPKGEERHSDQGLRARPMAQQQPPPPFPSSRYDKQFYGSSEDAHSGRNYAAADQRPLGAANPHPQSRHKSPPKASQYFGTTGRYDSANLSHADNAYNARTDTSYASRVGQPMASRPADQMFGNTGFGSTTGARGVAPMDPLMDYGYGREAQQPSGGSSFFQGGNWTAPSSSGRGVADMSSRAYPSNAGASSSSGSGLYNNAGTGEWGGMYTQRGGGQEQQTSNSSNRFPSSSYGKSAGTSYTQGGRRY